MALATEEIVIHEITPIGVDGRVGMKDPCFCGSGLRHKRCCHPVAKMVQGKTRTLLEAWRAEYEHRPLRECLVCGKLTKGLQTVLSLDAPCCPDHNDKLVCRATLDGRARFEVVK